MCLQSVGGSSRPGGSKVALLTGLASPLEWREQLRPAWISFFPVGFLSFSIPTHMAYHTLGVYLRFPHEASQGKKSIKVETIRLIKAYAWKLLASLPHILNVMFTFSCATRLKHL